MDITVSIDNGPSDVDAPDGIEGEGATSSLYLDTRSRQPLDERTLELRCLRNRRTETTRKQLRVADERLQTIADNYEDDFYRYLNIGSGQERQSDSDRAHLRTKMARTRRIIDAEKLYQQAKREARDAGLDASDLDESIFANQPYDGYRESRVHNTLAKLDKGKIYSWMDGVDKQAKAQRRFLPPPDAEALSARQRAAIIAIGENSSAIADGRNAERVETW